MKGLSLPECPTGCGAMGSLSLGGPRAPPGPARKPKGDLKGQILKPHLFHCTWSGARACEHKHPGYVHPCANSPRASRPHEPHTGCVCSPSHQGCALSSSKIKLSAVLFPILRLLLFKCHNILSADALCFASFPL